MPVVFSQPSPMSPQTSIDAGRAQVATSDFGHIVSMYDAANRNQLAASQASAQLGLQSSAATAHNAQQANLASTQMRERQQEFAAQQAPSQRDFFMAAQHQQQIAQQTAMNQWLMDQDLSQKEQMQLQEAQAGLATVMGDPTVSPEDKQEAMQLYQQHINPLKVRQQRMQQKILQQHAQEAVQAGTLQAVMENGTAEQRAKAFSKRVVMALDENGQPVLDSKGQPIKGWLDHRGDFKHFEEKQAGKDGGEAAAMKNVGGMTEKEWLAEHDRIKRRVHDLTTNKDKDTGRIVDRAGWDDSSREEAIRNDLRDTIGQTYGEYRQKRLGGGSASAVAPPVGTPPDQAPAAAGAGPAQPRVEFTPEDKALAEAVDRKIEERQQQQQQHQVSEANPEDRQQLRAMLDSPRHTSRFFSNRTHVSTHLAGLLNKVTGETADGETDVFGEMHYTISPEQKKKIKDLLKE